MRVRLTVTARPSVGWRRSEVGGQGKPVRFRRGPATVTGDAPRTTPLARRERTGKARGGRPGSQETWHRPHAIRVLAERNGSMQKTPRRLAGGLLAAGPPPLPPAAPRAARSVTVRVEGRASTIVQQVKVTTSANRTVGLTGHPTCSGLSALSALDAATGGDWSGRYFSGLGYAPDTVLGRPVNQNNSFFGFWMDHKFSDAGLCDARPKDGSEVLLFTTPFSEPAGGLLPLAVRPPASVTAGRRFRVRVVQYSKNGTATPGEGATVRFRRVGGGGRPSLTSDANGYVSLKTVRGRDLLVRAVKTDHVRSELDPIDVK